jgi:hypothetical protein
VIHKLYVRGNTKLYVRIPFGEIQIGTRHRSLTVWFRRRCYRIVRPT